MIDQAPSKCRKCGVMMAMCHQRRFKVLCHSMNYIQDIEGDGQRHEAERHKGRVCRIHNKHFQSHTLAMSSRRLRPGRPKAPNIPLSFNGSGSSSPYPSPHEVARLANTMTAILAVSDNIIQRDKEGNSCLPTTTLEKAYSLSTWVWEELSSLPLSAFAIPTLHKSLTMHKLTLIDIQIILTSNNPQAPEVSNDSIDQRLNDFEFRFQDLIKGAIDQQGSPNSTHFFQNSHHIIISGGTFTGSNLVVHDPVVRNQYKNILKVVYIQLGVLFV